MTALGFFDNDTAQEETYYQNQATSRLPAQKNAVILSPFYSRVTGTKWQAGRPAGIKREKDLAELLRYANDQGKRGMPRMAV